MRRILRYGKPVTVGLVALVLLCTAFFWTAPAPTFADGGGTGPMPKDTTDRCSGVVEADDPATISTVSLALVVVGAIL